MTRPARLAPMLSPPVASGAIRSPKTAELLARTLRRMIVDGRLRDGDYLPHEAELTAHFQVSRPTLREAVRVLESERLVEVRRGARTGARIRVPGPEIVARPAGLLLELSGATVADVLTARTAIEPAAAELLARTGDTEAFAELESLVEENIPAAYQAGTLARATAHLHRRMVELSGNVTLAMIAGMLHEITERHTANALLDADDVTQAQFRRLLHSYRRLLELLRAGDGKEAAAHWRKHMDNANAVLLAGHESTKVRDVME